MSLIAANARRTPVLQIHPNAPKAHSDTGWSKCSNRPHTQARAHTLGVDNTSKMASARTKSLSRPRVTSDEFQLARERNFLNARMALGQICCGELLLHSPDASDLSAICISDGPGWNSAIYPVGTFHSRGTKATWLDFLKFGYDTAEIKYMETLRLQFSIILSFQHTILSPIYPLDQSKSSSPTKSQNL